MVLAVITVPLLINIIGIDGYGLWVLVSSALAIVSLAEGGISMSTVVFVSQDLKNSNWKALSETLTIILSAMLILATIAAIILWLGSDTIAGFFPKLSSEQKDASILAMQLGGIVIWGRLLQQVASGIMQAYMRFGILNIYRTLQALMQTIGLVIVAYLGGTIVDMMQWLVIVSLIMLLAYTFFDIHLLKDSDIKPAWNKQKGIVILRYSLLTWGSSIGGVLFTRFDRILVGRILGISTLGIYSAMTDIAVQINSLSAIAVNPILPMISAVWEKGESNKINVERGVKQALQINIFIALGLGAGLLAFSPFILDIVFPEPVTTDMLTIFRVIVSIYAYYSLSAVGYFVLFGIKAVNIVLKTQLLVGFVSLFMIALLSYQFGIVGAVIGNAVYIGVFWLNIKGMKLLGIPMKHWTHWISMPLLYFSVLFLIVLLLPEYTIFHVGVFTIIIIFWVRAFWREQQLDVRLIFESLLSK